MNLTGPGFTSFVTNTPQRRIILKSAMARAIGKVFAKGVTGLSGSKLAGKIDGKIASYLLESGYFGSFEFNCDPVIAAKTGMCLQ